MDSIGTPLKDWNININRGILTGLNDAFIIDDNKRQELISKDSKSDEVIRPILRGRDIKRYSYEYADLWLIYIPWHFPLHKDGTITGASDDAELAFKVSYPAVYNHLLSFKKELLARNQAETGIRYEWYAMQRWGANYWDDFFKQKIVWGNLNLKASYCLAEPGMYINAPCTMIVDASKYLLAVLNSKLADYYIRSLGVTRNGGYFEYKPMFIEKLPVPSAPGLSETIIEELVDQILQQRESGEDTSFVENQIDKLIYEIYDLNDEEVQFIEGIPL
jgi:hypothetical protein